MSREGQNEADVTHETHVAQEAGAVPEPKGRVATEKVSVTKEQKDRFNQLGTAGTKQREIFEQMLSTYESLGQDGVGLLEKMCLMTGEEAVNAEGVHKVLTKLGFLVGYGGGSLFDLGVGLTQRAQIVTFFEETDPYQTAAMILAFGFQGLINTHGLTQLSSLWEQAAKIIIENQPKKVEGK